MPDALAKLEFFLTKTGEERTAYPIAERENWFVEDGVKVIRRYVQIIHSAVENAKNKHHIDSLGKTKVIIISDTTLSKGALSAYDYVNDVLKIGYYVTNKNAFKSDKKDEEDKEEVKYEMP